MDVKLIYNKDEKMKKYNECVDINKHVQEDLTGIDSKVDDLNGCKGALADCYIMLEKQFTNFTASVGNQYIFELKNQFYSLVGLQTNYLTKLMERKLSIENISISVVFYKMGNLKYQELLNNNK